MKKLNLLMTLTIALFLTACSSPEDGVDGVNGINGQPGATGATGATGSANVIYSAWLTAPAAVAATIDGTTGIATSIDAPELSQAILDKGTILVYMNFGNDVFSLPYTSYAGGSNSTISSSASLKKIKLFRYAHVAGQTTSLPTNLKWRYILIPGGVAASTLSKDYSTMSYDEVLMSLNIQ